MITWINQFLNWIIKNLWLNLQLSKSLNGNKLLHMDPICRRRGTVTIWLQFFLRLSKQNWVGPSWWKNFRQMTLFHNFLNWKWVGLPRRILVLIFHTNILFAYNSPSFIDKLMKWVYNSQMLIYKCAYRKL